MQAGKHVFSASLLFLLPALSGCETMQAIDRGLYTATEAVTERDKITGDRTISVEDRAEQIRLGNQAAENFVTEAKAAGKRINEAVSPVAYARIKRIFSQLHEVSHVRDEQWTPVLVEENEWNAFTTGGTYFVIHSGLESDLSDDSELANVIAHEMAHTVANHVFEGQSYMTLSALAKSKSTTRDSFRAAFSHENEAEADRIAILYCAIAGYDPFAGERIWSRMHQRNGDDGLFLQDHPMNSERAEQAHRIATQVAQYYSSGKINPDHEAILASNEVYVTSAPSEAAAGSGGGLLAVLETTLATMNQQQHARTEERRQQQRIAFLRSVHQVSSIVESVPVGPDRWRVTIQYRGNRPLTDLVVKLRIEHGETNPTVITKQLAGILRPGSTFSVDFVSSEFNAYNVNPRNVMFMYDGARAL
jgi:hypothetical protein